jgi:hypothetical protein
MKGKNSKRWTEPELEVLFEYYASHGPQFVSELLSAKGYNRSRRACGITGRLVGLEYKGPRMCFQPGHAPINKGRKMKPETFEKCARTMFRQGKLPKNTKPIGTEICRADGYWWVKTAQPNAWVQKHRLLWEQANGPIPPGMLVIFKDGNPNNICLDNLEIITRKQAVTRNRWGSGPSEFSLISGRAAKARLNKMGIGDRAIRQNPELIPIAQAQTILKLKLRKQKQ